MGGRKWSILVAIFILLLAMEAVIAQGQGNGNGNGNGNGKDKDKEEKEREKREKKEKKEKEKEKKEKEKKDKKQRDEATNYDKLSSLPTGQERGFCRTNTTCEFKTIVCPSECASRKPKKNKKQKACFIDCSSSTCEATCKVRKANCDGYGALCYDPRFVGGDGVMFYFHGAKGGNFAIVSDDEFQINAHFIGTRPQGRTRDYTWVQALAVMFDTHTLVIAANRVSHWDDKVDSLIVKWDDELVNIPTDGEAEWRINGDEREVVVERTDGTNSVRVTVSGLVEMDISVKPIGEQENKVHNYQLPSDDAFAHLETQFKFKKSTDNFEGVLGQTYRPGYVSPVKRGVPMPMMGGEDKYQTLSLFSTSCNLCKFHRPSEIASIEGLVAQY
ncbi:hypothetical protein GLYMA_12G068700v4 [Glycine max]|uniref:Root cap n=1 Tax=Glycine max TaxID=3847 RepID=I1LQW9_SOYBN|nr:uncharacterized protein LOC100789697 [Glycine max]KAG4979761.1 hypothetical protein JHK85_033719 [Glycine max]KAG4985412.1 hypothetical protein JHK86_033103 [Glycine max]KAG5139581.1 hypothetical protein JHK84_033349 [Glycine max]KAH1141979.1 hypothetical protein GYH30_032934 [Glycine max]KAH1220421.1 hypothetical protein GmHk_12G034078 [Glycine max]|eukprot:XP_003539717.1 uncharacterized protein LOC100789697 [Glycine max]